MLPTIPSFLQEWSSITSPEKIHTRLLKEVITRIRKKLKMDDERGAVPIVTGYVDDVNALVTIVDASEYLRLFEEIGVQLEANL